MKDKKINLQCMTQNMPHTVLIALILIMLKLKAFNYYMIKSTLKICSHGIVVGYMWNSRVPFFAITLHFMILRLEFLVISSESEFKNKVQFHIYFNKLTEIGSPFETSFAQ